MSISKSLRVVGPLRLGFVSDGNEDAMKDQVLSVVSSGISPWTPLITAVTHADLGAAQRVVHAFGPEGNAHGLGRDQIGNPRASEVTARYLANCGTYEDVDAMLAGRELDVVFAGGSEEFRTVAAIRAMEAECDVYLDPPTTLDALNTLARVASSQEVVVGLGGLLPHQLNPVRELVADGVLGSVRDVEFAYRQFGLEDQIWPEAQTGDVHWDLGRLVIGVVLSFIKNEAVEVRGRRGSRSSEIEIRFRDGVRAFLEMTRSETTRRSELLDLRLSDRNGSAIHAPVLAPRADALPRLVSPIAVTHAGAHIAMEERSTLGYTAGVIARTQNFVYACQGGEELALTIHEAVAGELLLLKAGESAGNPGRDGWGPWLPA